MNRREFLKTAAATLFFNPTVGFSTVRLIADEKKALVSRINNQGSLAGKQRPGHFINDEQVKDYLIKLRNPDSPHETDIALSDGEKKLLNSVVERLRRLCITVGYANFALLGFESAIRYARNYSSVGEFTREELDFLEMIYSREANDYGFYGEKQLVDMNQEFSDKDTIKVPGSGNFLFKGESLEKYKQIEKDLGADVQLTSGIRGFIKQVYLFLNKAQRHDGNLSLASRSLAPPGYSFHATGDFDVGQWGLGKANFSEQFTKTVIFKRLTEQGLVAYRYQQDNMLGVRYEPWHIKI